MEEEADGPRPGKFFSIIYFHVQLCLAQGQDFSKGFALEFSVYQNLKGASRRKFLSDARMAHAFLLILFTAGFGLVFATPVILIPWLFAPRNKTPMKVATFEAGQVPQGDARVHLLMQYYAYLLIFVIVDVVSMFLFAWASVTIAIPLSGVIAIGIFLLLIFVPLGYGIHLARRRELW